MKKPTQRFRQWNRIHAWHSDRRRLIYSAYRKEQNTYNNQIKKVKHAGKSYVPVTCPEDFSLETNIEEVTDVLNQIRQQSENRGALTYIDFRRIRNLSPDAALVLVAELDRWNHNPRDKGRLFARDIEEWDPKVRRLFADMGFFEILSVKYNQNMADKDKDKTDTRFVKFRVGEKADGEAIDKLRREDLDPVLGSIPQHKHLYGALTEAMTNVVQHAYRGSDNFRQCWWLSASYNAARSEVTIMIYDQGAGIPSTLPRTYSERLLKLANSDHAHIIEVAHDLARTSSDSRHRGHGLERDIRGYFEKLDCLGHYRVISQKGEYIVKRGEGGKNATNKGTHSPALRGTMIEWHLRL